MDRWCGRWGRYSTAPFSAWLNYVRADKQKKRGRGTTWREALKAWNQHKTVTAALPAWRSCEFMSFRAAFLLLSSKSKLPFLLIAKHLCLYLSSFPCAALSVCDWTQFVITVHISEATITAHASQLSKMLVWSDDTLLYLCANIVAVLLQPQNSILNY